MANRIVVDPITRIEGHLRIEAEIKRMGVTREQAISDWDVRFEICKNAVLNLKL